MEGGADVHVDSRYGWPNTQAATVHVSGTLRGTSHCTVPGIQEAAWRQLLPLLQLLQQRLLGGGGGPDRGRLSTGHRRCPAGPPAGMNFLPLAYRAPMAPVSSTEAAVPTAKPVSGEPLCEWWRACVGGVSTRPPVGTAPPPVQHPGCRHAHQARGCSH